MQINFIIFSYFFVCLPISHPPVAEADAGQAKKYAKKDSPAECFPPLSENIENLDKVIPTPLSGSGDADGAFADFLMFSNSRPPTPPAGQASAPNIS
ncbi:MAG TPA: hypothetical protein PKI01_02250 [Bacteroidales bacterium]|nr:hypothetical protein [Bacteroidales bacterium]